MDDTGVQSGEIGQDSTSEGSQQPAPPAFAKWEAEFTAFYAEQYAALLHIAARTLRSDRAAAEDCVQAAVTAAWTHRARYASTHEPRALLMTAVKHRALDDAKRARRTGRRAVASEVLSSIPERCSTNSERELALKDEISRALIDDLTPGERVAFYLMIVRELSAQETAGVLRVSVKSAQNRLSEARTKLRTALGQPRDERRPPVEDPRVRIEARTTTKQRSRRLRSGRWHPTKARGTLPAWNSTRCVQMRAGSSTSARFDAHNHRPSGPRAASRSASSSATADSSPATSPAKDATRFCAR